ncbi:nitroreductase [Idiomarina aquatica]|uniref:Nitroreductase n=1 Tax=Idiomarina aquatica TaxID=1327752 RepID=A0A4R6PQG8_9GAMM|nr:nitroreductase family protein [Idiomarina aquatica]TDP40228.1 nitroreductase [Idiomarina aquatica]
MKQLIKRLIPSALLGTVKKQKEATATALTQLMGRSRWLAKLGYGVLSSLFSRENYVTAAGIRRHHQLDKEPTQQSHARLRRNTHRLEKGLTMQPRREVFGLAYLGQLVDDFRSQASKGNACQEELQWANSVLTEYFSFADESEPAIKRARARFLACGYVGNQQNYSPYERQTSLQSRVEFDEFKKLAMQRRSVRWFTDERVPRSLVERAMQAATLAPSACNRQPFNVYIIDEDDALKRAVKQPMGTAGWEHNIPMLAVFVGDFSCFEAARDRHVPYIDASLAAMNFMLALETLGLASCPINWPDIEIRERRMAKLLKLDAWQRPIMCMAIGYAQEEGGIAFSQKKLPEQLIRYVE